MARERWKEILLATGLDQETVRRPPQYLGVGERIHELVLVHLVDRLERLEAEVVRLRAAGDETAILRMRAEVMPKKATKDGAGAEERT